MCDLLKLVLGKFGHLEHKWHSSHLSHRGNYSIERLQAFEEYCQQTSSFQVLSVCLVLPLPALVISILVECIPLQNPLDGWEANYGYWIRFFAANLCVGLGFLIQIKQMIPDLDLTLMQVAFINVTSTTCALGTYILVAYCWAFPVPFGLVLLISPYVMALIFIFMAVVGKERFKRNASLKCQLRDFAAIVMAMSCLCIVYPAFGAAYNGLSPDQQTFFIILLPIIKATMSSVVAKAARNMIDSIPGIVLLSVEVFNALYSAKCMQNAGSGKTYAAILAWDIFESVMAFRDIRSQIAKFQPLLSRHKLSNSKTTPLLRLVMQLCLEPGVLDANSTIRVRSMLKLKTTTLGKANLEKLECFTKAPLKQSKQQSNVKITLLNGDPERHSADPSAAKNMDTSQRSAVKQKTQQTSFLNANMMVSRVFPHQGPALKTANVKNCISTKRMNCTPIEMLQPKVWPNDNFGTDQDMHSPRSLTEKRLIIEETLDILFRCEFYILVEFIECVIPLIYALYMMAVFHLPSVKYYPDTVHMTPAQLQHIVLNIILYASLEIASLIVIHYAIKWKFGFSPGYILGFVLKNQFFEFQGRLVVWYLYVLQLMLYHTGDDFTLQFEWMRKRNH